MVGSEALAGPPISGPTPLRTGRNTSNQDSPSEPSSLPAILYELYLFIQEKWKSNWF